MLHSSHGHHNFLSIMLFVIPHAFPFLTSEITSLCGIVAFLLQARDAAEQELKLAVRSAGDVLRDLVTGHVDGDEGQAALGVGAALEAGACGVELWGVVGVGAKRQVLDSAQALVIGHEEVVDGAGRGLEALCAIPRHVLDGEQRAVSEEEEVQHAVPDDGIVGPLDDGREGAESGWDGLVSVGEEVTAACAHEVVGWGNVELGLDVAPVEIVMRTSAKRRETHLVPEVRAVVRQVVDVKARVDV
jgi:hypothetical protein